MKRNDVFLSRPFFFILCCFIFIIVPPALHAQFNGDFSIERHHLNLENFPDWKSYQPPISWQHEWLRTDTGLRIITGSISMYEFYTLFQLRYSKEIGRYSTFYYDQVEESFYRQEPVYQELEIRLGGQLGVSFIGYPPHHKRLGHLGYAVSWGKRNRTDFVRLSMMEQYGFFNEKNANNEKHSVNESFITCPVLYRLEAQYFIADRWIIDAAFKTVTEAEFEDEKADVLKTYRGDAYRVSVDWRGGNGRLAGFTAFRDYHRREHKPETPSAGLPDLAQDLLLRWADVYYRTSLAAKHLLTVGFLDSAFINAVDSDYMQHRYDHALKTSLLYGFWEYAKSDWFHWRFGLLTGNVKLTKDFIDPDESGDESNVEIKANVGVIMMEKESYRMFWNTTWDIDAFGERQWDGGNAQLQLKF